MFESYDKIKTQRVEAEEPEESKLPFDPERDITEEDRKNVEQDIVKTKKVLAEYSSRDDAPMDSKIFLASEALDEGVFINKFCNNKAKFTEFEKDNIKNIVKDTVRGGMVLLSMGVALRLHALLGKEVDFPGLYDHSGNRSHVGLIYEWGLCELEGKKCEIPEQEFEWGNINYNFNVLKTTATVGAFSGLALVIKKLFPHKMTISADDWELMNSSLVYFRERGLWRDFSGLALNMAELAKLEAKPVEPQKISAPPVIRKF